jgi:hypothetical protein
MSMNCFLTNSNADMAAPDGFDRPILSLDRRTAARGLRRGVT